jgi:hypothetical protein
MNLFKAIPLLALTLVNNAFAVETTKIDTEVGNVSMKL